MEQAEAQKQKKKIVIVIHKKSPDLGFFLFLVNHDF
jgi:hypothetical protein